jgi:gluconokinase
MSCQQLARRSVHFKVCQRLDSGQHFRLARQCRGTFRVELVEEPSPYNPINAIKNHSPHILSIDLGTSGIRGAVYDVRGDEVAGTASGISRKFGLSADGGAETDATELAGQAESILTQVLAASSDLRIEAIAIATLWHALLGIDDAGQPVTPIYGWADTRAGQEADELRVRLDEAAIHQRTGCRFHPGYWPAKIMWLRARRPELFARVRKWISPGDYLRLRWTGTIATSVSMASATGLFDQRRCDWDDELTSATGIGRVQLPDIEIESDAVRFGAGVRSEWSKLFNTRIFPAIGDGAANNIGVGCIDKGEVALMIGTSGAMRLAWKGEPPDEIPPGLWQYRIDRDRVVVGGALSDGGGLFRWMRDSLSLPDDAAVLEHQLGAAVPDGHGLTLLPFWAGERSTGWNAAARGGVFGMTLDTKPLDLVRAAMEGVAYRFAAIAEQLDQIGQPLVVRAAGGALRDSPAWGQILADVLGRPIQVTRVNEATGRGTALLGLERLGYLSDLSSVSPPLERTIEPDPRNFETYQRARQRQQQLRDQLYGPEA